MFFYFLELNGILNRKGVIWFKGMKFYYDIVFFFDFWILIKVERGLWDLVEFYECEFDRLGYLVFKMLLF